MELKGIETSQPPVKSGNALSVAFRFGLPGLGGLKQTLFGGIESVAGIGINGTILSLQKRKLASKAPRYYVESEGAALENVLFKHKAKLQGVGFGMVGLGAVNMAAGGFNMAQAYLFARDAVHAGLQHATQTHGASVIAAVGISGLVPILSEPIHKKMASTWINLVADMAKLKEAFGGQKFRLVDTRKERGDRPSVLGL